MEENPAPPPGGDTGTQNPDGKPRAFQQGSENPSTPQPQTQNPSTPSQTTSTNPSKTPTLMDLQAPTEGFSFFDTPTPDPAQNPGRVVNPAEQEEDLMQDILTAEVQQEEQSELIKLARMEQTKNIGTPDSPTTRVSSGTWGPLPKITRGNTEKPEIKNPEPAAKNPDAQNTSTPEPMVTQGSPSTPGTKEGTPHLVTPPAKDPSPKKKVSYAGTVKGVRPQNSPFQQTICEIDDEEAANRTPPPTDVTFSVWIDLSLINLSHDDIKAMAEKHPNIKGAGLRKEAQWLECYCGSIKDVNHLLEHPMQIDEEEIVFIKARKLVGDKLVIKLANINPSPPEEVTREALLKALKTVAQVEKVEPVYLKTDENVPKEQRLCTRRWNALVYVEEGTRFVVHPLFDLFGTTIIMTWKNSPCPVCHHCKEAGHWTDQCTPAHRTLATQRKLNKMKPAPLPEKAPTTQDPVQPAEKPAKTGTAEGTPKTEPPKKQQEKKDNKQPKQREERAEASTSRTSTKEKEQQAIKQSQKALAEEGFLVMSSGDETQQKTTPKEPAKEEKPKRKYTEDRRVRNITVTSVTTRARAKGNLTDYALYLLKIGSSSVPKVTQMLIDIKPQEFVEITKPGMTKQFYGNFGKFVDRRKQEGKDTIAELVAYKVSIPEYLIPGNANFVDTSVAPKKTKENKRKRKKAESTTTAESSADERSTEAQPVTRAIVHYIDEEGNPANFRIKYTRNMYINTLAKAIQKKRKISGNFQLLRKSDNSPLDFQKTATEVGLQNEEELVINMEFVQEEEEPEGIEIKIIPKGASKIWTKRLPPHTSTTNIYMQFAEHIRKKHTDFTLYRSDGTVMNRYTSLEKLNLRRFEILKEENEETIPMNIHWLDTKKQQQQKATYLPHSLNPKLADWHIRHELGLEFDFELDTEEAIINDHPTITELNNAMVSNRLYLKRPTQNKWDDPEFKEEIGIAELQIKHSPTSAEFFTFSILDGHRTINVLQDIAEQEPELAGNLILDINGTPFDLLQDLYMSILPGVRIQAYLSPKNKYPQDAIDRAIRKIALVEEVPADALATDRFPNISHLP